MTWNGPAGERDFISIDPAGAPEREYGAYVYASKGSPATLPGPGTPGDYEVRYHSGESGYPVLARAAVRVTPASATLEAPATAEMGGTLAVTWSGPDNPRDFISIDPEDAGDSEYGAYAYTSKGSPVELPAPSEPGTFVVRYHLGVSGYPVIASTPVSVVGASATLEVPDRVDAGSVIPVAWTGPDNERDFISIDPPDAAESEYGRYAYTSSGSPVEIQVPDEPGRYLVRYHLGSSGYPVIGSAPVDVGAVAARVEPSETIVAGEPFEVTWSGPDNEGDFVTIVPPGAPEREYGNFAYTRRGNPLRLEAPDDPGAYEVRYLTGQSYRQLAAAAVDVQPGSARGTLRVLAPDEANGSASAVGAVEIVLDASGSMLQRLDGTRRIELARDALLDLTGQTLPDGVPFALRVFGHREADSCRTDLEIPLAPLDRDRAAATIRSIEAKNLAKTPIADSLSRARQDLAGASGPLLIVLVTDGEETCGGDPAAAIGELAQAGIDVRVNIVGFAIDELMLEEEFERWARLGGGRYLDAADGEALQEAMRSALRSSFEVLSGDEVVASGTVGGDVVELAPGQYRVLVGDGRELGPVTIRGGQEAVLRLDGPLTASPDDSLGAGRPPPVPGGQDVHAGWAGWRSTPGRPGSRHEASIRVRKPRAGP
ncbi:MAG TPA: VWA domain-containing protein [Thermoanaerobaculia bacterium]|nr:VWA domain-containing protein [Thermoanaerobaculia bacterium]